MKKKHMRLIYQIYRIVNIITPKLNRNVGLKNQGMGNIQNMLMLSF